MPRLVIQLPKLQNDYDGRLMRDFARQIEDTFARITVEDRRGAYTITADTTLGALDDTVLVDTAGGNVTVTLPEISDAMIRDRRKFEVVKSVAANRVDIAPSGSDTIAGETGIVLTSKLTAMALLAATGGWVIV